MTKQEDREETNKRAAALLSFLESDFGQSGRDVRIMAIIDELNAAYLRGVNAALGDSI